MKLSTRTIGFGLVTLAAGLSLTYAQRPMSGGGPRGDGGGGGGGGGGRAEPAHESGHVQESHPAVDRFDHGSIRHSDSHVVERHVDVHARPDSHPRIDVHHDVDVDISRRWFWHGFQYGYRVHALRPGFRRIFVAGVPYFYDDGIYYQPVGDDYEEVYPPVGADIPEPPDGSLEIDAGGVAYYYAGGAFYVQQGDGYVVAPPPMGVTVPELPPGAVEVSVKGNSAYQYNGIYYQPVFVDGVTQYMTFMP